MKFDYQKAVDFHEVLRINLLYDPMSVRYMTLLGALQLTELHQYRQAISILQKVLDINYLAIDAYFWLALCHCHLNESFVALKIIDQALQINPQRADCISLKAYILWDEKIDPILSIKCLKEALFLAPFWPQLHLELISFQYTLGNYKEALQQVQTAQSLLQIPPVTTDNPVEAYYEKWVTGRSWSDLDRRLMELQGRIFNEQNN